MNIIRILYRLYNFRPAVVSYNCITMRNYCLEFDTYIWKIQAVFGEQSFVYVGDSEANSSELLEHLEDMFLHY